MFPMLNGSPAYGQFGGAPQVGGGFNGLPQQPMGGMPPGIPQQPGIPPQGMPPYAGQPPINPQMQQMIAQRLMGGGMPPMAQGGPVMGGPTMGGFAQRPGQAYINR